jgi:hypothetical protein
MSIRFFLNWKEYFSAQEFFRRDRYNVSPESVIGGVLMTLSSLWFFIDDLNMLAAIGFAAGLVIFLGVPLSRRWSLKRKWKREPLYQSEHSVSFSEEGIHYLMGQVDSNLDWKYYQRLLESPEGFLLIYGNDSFNLLPKRAFASEKMIDDFRALATSKLSKKPVGGTGGNR